MWVNTNWLLWIPAIWVEDIIPLDINNIVKQDENARWADIIRKTTSNSKNQSSLHDYLFLTAGTREGNLISGVWREFQSRFGHYSGPAHSTVLVHWTLTQGLDSSVPCCPIQAGRHRPAPMPLTAERNVSLAALLVKSSGSPRCTGTEHSILLYFFDALKSLT